VADGIACGMAKSRRASRVKHHDIRRAWRQRARFHGLRARRGICISARRAHMRALNGGFVAAFGAGGARENMALWRASAPAFAPRARNSSCRGAYAANIAASMVSARRGAYGGGRKGALAAVRRRRGGADVIAAQDIRRRTRARNARGAPRCGGGARHRCGAALKTAHNSAGARSRSV